MAVTGDSPELGPNELNILKNTRIGCQRTMVCNTEDCEVRNLRNKK